MSLRKLALMGFSAFALVLVILVVGLNASHQPREAWPTTLVLSSTRGPLAPDTLANGAVGHLNLLVPGFTHCPDICPLSLARLQMVWQTLDGSKRERIHPLFLTLDPARDTLPVLTRYLSAFSLPVTGVRLPDEGDSRLADFTQRLGIQYHVRPQSSQHMQGHRDAYMVDHSVAIFVLDDQGRLRDTLPLSQTPAQLADRLALLLKDVSSAPLAEGAS
ncbi:SCO family protein [Cobetia crustatorum]|uniref:SCO family protein n=1 Tax=Cobetia crustatorum TaxID=553385 RepID=UPI0004680D9B|nr:SCO family protein [Cobetia crustatorum]